ncbi:MAG: ATP-binding protein [Candidatus Micrarchaeota archaeon]
MTEIFAAREKLLKGLGWSENPFVKDLRTADKSSFVSYYCPFEAESILKKLAFDAKACLLFGPKGVGKTSALYYVYYSLPETEFDLFFFKEMPDSLTDLASEAGLLSPPGFLDGLKTMLGRKIKREITRAQLVSKLKSRGKKIVFFLDEAHLHKDKSMYMELKYLLDDVPNLRMVVSSMDKNVFPDSLLHLFGEANIFQRKNFTLDEMKRIVGHRIEAVGGSGVKPFSSAFLERVLSEKNLLSPRYVFDDLNEYLAEVAVGKPIMKPGEEYSDDLFIRSVVDSMKEPSITTNNVEWWVSLSPAQQKIIELLVKYPNGLTLNEIKRFTELRQNTAFNALYQLRGQDDAEITRKPDVPFPLVVVKAKAVGGRKKNIYFIEGKVKTLFTLT